MYIGDFEKLCCVPGAPKDHAQGQGCTHVQERPVGALILTSGWPWGSAHTESKG